MAKIISLIKYPSEEKSVLKSIVEALRACVQIIGLEKLIKNDRIRFTDCTIYKNILKCTK